jgi:hypothetical protein
MPRGIQYMCNQSFANSSVRAAKITDNMYIKSLWCTTSSGHGSFSDNAALNSVVGHLLHSFVLVPYHGWYVRTPCLDHKI